MTIEELQQLTDKQLIEKVATEVMGWKKFKGPDSSSEWDWEWYEVTEKELKEHSKYWDPLTCWDNTMEMIEKLQELNLSFALCTWVCELTIYGKQATQARDDNPRKAICFAVLLSTQPHDT